ncbi:MAG TPA: amidohydrolase family protein, partial [Candidatus Saccharimonadales bacterium]
TIEHGMYLHQRPELLKAMATKGIFLVPTLSGYYWMAGINDAIDPADGERNPWMPASLTELADYNIQEGGKSLRAAKEAGVKIVLGSDAAASTALEVQRMIFHGLTSFESLQAGTKNAAEALGLSDQIGTVEEGRLADLLILDGDPLAKPELLCDSRKIWLVLQLGTPVAGQALECDLGFEP